MDKVIRRLFEAFKRRDGAAMGHLYANNANFHDPVFETLRGDEIGRMWRMLCERADDLEIDYEVIDVTDKSATVRWEAKYTFKETGRPVHNVIESKFEGDGARIHRQTDDFSFWKWSQMALGPTGLLLGWTPLVKSKVRSQCREALDAFF